MLLPRISFGLAALGLALVVVPAALRPPPDAAPPAAAAPDSLDDGPHVYWQGDRTGVVFYLCRDSVRAERFEAADTLSFPGRCADSAEVYRLPTRSPRPARDTWDRVPRILALSDIHGEYDALVAFLRNARVIDAAGRWTWGDGHLVVVGDVVDRGARVTECLWFLRRLELDAERAGGRVHLVLGNHEVMVMRDDLRYVHPRYLSGIVRLTGVRYPDLFGPDMELGRWLRSKPFVLKLNDLVFTHGGLGPDLPARNLDIRRVNEIGRESLDLSSVALTFSDLPGLLLGSAGPLWYRGYLRGADSASADSALTAVLRFYHATAMVVGHTDVGQLTRRYGGRLYAIDVSLERLGAFQGLLWENGGFSLVTGAGAVEPLP
jgi:hypothetical protein